MDWTDYPKQLDPAALVDDAAGLAAFLGVDETYLTALILLDAQTQAVPEARDQLARAFPRETLAYRTMSAYTPTPTAAELRDALAAIPDAEPEPPATVEMLPLILRRLQVTATPDGGATIMLSARTDIGSPWRDLSWRVPAPAIEIAPVLLQQSTGAAITVRVTVPGEPQ